MKIDDPDPDPDRHQLAQSVCAKCKYVFNSAIIWFDAQEILPCANPVFHFPILNRFETISAVICNTISPNSLHQTSHSIHNLFNILL